MKTKILILLLLGTISFQTVKSQCTTPVTNSNDAVPNRVPVYGAGNCLRTSVIFEGSSMVGINMVPNYTLDVYGDANVRSFKSYKIGGNTVLWNNAFTSDIFLGAGSGNATMTGHFNTFLGSGVGTSTTTGANNTGIGNGALSNVKTGNNNTANGCSALFGNMAGSGNTATGVNALKLNNADHNTANGSSALSSNTTGVENTANGYGSLQANTTANNNTATGSLSLTTNTTGANNTANGYGALQANTTASSNTATGSLSLTANTTGDQNTASGYSALTSNTTGALNTAYGEAALAANVGGNRNTAIGAQAAVNTASNDNTAVGFTSLLTNTAGVSNTSIGATAGIGNTNATFCTYVGYGATASGNYANAGAFGNGAISTAPNKIYMGNAALIGVYDNAGMFLTSDGRFKTNVTENVKGLEFINKLRPVTYNLDTKALDDFMIQNMPADYKKNHQSKMNFEESKAIIHSGFIAQEVEKTEEQTGFKSSIVSKPANSTDPYALNYAEIVVPLVKAVQELTKLTDNMQKEIAELKNKKNINSASSVNEIPSSTNVSLKDGQSVVLDQNVPNPFAEQTTINYYLPDNATKAQMLFYNSNGNLIKSVELEQRGKGQLNVFGNDLTNGVYTYTLVVDGKILDTKKMAKQ